MNKEQQLLSEARKAEVFIEPISVNVATAARMLGISDRMLYDIARTAGFPSFKIGERTLISVEGLRRWVDEQVKKGVNIFENRAV